MNVKLKPPQVRTDGAVNGSYGKKTFSRQTDLNQDWIHDLEDRIIAMEDGQIQHFEFHRQ